MLLSDLIPVPYARRKRQRAPGLGAAQNVALCRAVRCAWEGLGLFARLEQEGTLARRVLGNREVVCLPAIE